jgi:Helicase conserved C-terminal domain
MPRIDETQPRTLREAFSEMTVDELKPLASLLGATAMRKGDLVDLLAKALEDQARVRGLYDSLDDVGKKALQEAGHDPEGALDLFMFKAKYGRTPSFGGSGSRYGSHKEKPTVLRLFFPRRNALPRDLQSILRGFVPEPPPPTVQAIDDLPATVGRPDVGPGRSSREEETDEVELRQRQTARPALQDVKAILRLIDMGEVRVSEKTRRPSLAAMKVITGVLADGDFYAEADQSKDAWEPASDLHIQSFAWPMLVQAAGLAEAAGTRLKLTAAGRKATTRPAHELIRQIWEKWQKTTLVDEFSRINAIKGQQAKGRGLTAVAPRRRAIVEVLAECPAQKWITVDELFRLLKALARDFEVTHDAWKLYISEQQYGSLGYDNSCSWEMLQGRFTLAFLFEYAATLGLLDVAYLVPDGVRNDYSSSWGTDDLSCLSRYDGLIYFRINALGAWCLGLEKNYEPAVVPREPLLKVLPNRDVVATDRPLAPADTLFLERFAERKSEAVWQLDAGKILESVGKGLTVEELRMFLEAKGQGPLPQTVKVFLDDTANKLSQLEDLGPARLIACRDADVAHLLVHDRRLRSLCQLAGERQIVFRSTDETTIRRVLKELGYVLPPP